jgi:hypothetical protein
MTTLQVGRIVHIRHSCLYGSIAIGCPFSIPTGSHCAYKHSPISIISPASSKKSPTFSHFNNLEHRTTHLYSTMSFCADCTAKVTLEGTPAGTSRPSPSSVRFRRNGCLSYDARIEFPKAQLRRSTAFLFTRPSRRASESSFCKSSASRGSNRSALATTRRRPFCSCQTYTELSSTTTK